MTDTSGHPYGTCAVYGDSSYQWGPVKTADVVIGQEKASSVPIEVIDFTFGDTGNACAALDGGVGGLQTRRPDTTEFWEFNFFNKTVKHSVTNAAKINFIMVVVTGSTCTSCSFL